MPYCPRPLMHTLQTENWAKLGAHYMSEQHTKTCQYYKKQSAECLHVMKYSIPIATTKFTSTLQPHFPPSYPHSSPGHQHPSCQ
jgi:hypothetical protein